MACLTALVAGLAAGCGESEASSVDNVFVTAEVERRDIVSSVEATGTVEPIKVVEVKSQASGEILEMNVELGDDVQQGDLLLEIDPRDVQNNLEQARADLEQSRARLQVARQQLERLQVLRDSGVVTEEELEAAILEHANARSAFVKAETSLELARDRRQDATVRAPITGTIIEKNVEEGQVITSADAVTGGTVLLRMADLSDVQVRTLVDETDIGRVVPGLQATITVEAYPNEIFRGEVLKIEPQAVVEQNVTMFAVLTRIQNEQGLLRPGMNADVEIVVGRRENVLALPNGAIKLPDETRQLVDALGLDRSLLEKGRQGASGTLAVRSGGSPPDGTPAVEGAATGAPTDPASAREGGQGGLPGPEALQSMSQEERQKLFESLSPAQRRQLFQRMRGARESAETARRANPTAPRQAFVFERDSTGQLTLKPVTIGLSSWEYTEILSGLEPGDRVVQIPLSIVQQQDLLERIRRRTSIPGMGGG